MFIEHVNLSVSDLDKGIQFYCELFDFELRWRRGTESGERPAAHVGNDKYYLALFLADEPIRKTKEFEQIGLNHFGVVVDDIKKYESRLANLGVTPHAIEDYEPGKRLYFRDLDGIEVELVQYEN